MITWVCQVLAAMVMGIAPRKRSGRLARLALALDGRNLNALRVVYLKANRDHSVMRRLENIFQLGLRDPVLSLLAEKYFYYCRAQRFQELEFLKAFPRYEFEMGYFVEIGVGDGLHLSNSYLFEKALGWSGLLVEANPECWHRIRQSRHAMLDTRPAWKEGGVSMRFLCTSTPEYSGFSESVRSKQLPSQLGEIIVETVRTEDIFVENNVPDHVSFMSVDTEGSELEILQGIDFSRRTFDFLCVEHNQDKAKKQALIQLLGGVGYKLMTPDKSGDDFWFVLEAQVSGASAEGRLANVST